MKKIPTLKQLQYLIALYEQQHFGRAAAACYISQSTLSASITHLEETLGAQILERNHKAFIFTPLGEEIVRRSRLLLEQSEELTDYAKNQQNPMQGVMHLGIIPTIAPFILKELLFLCRQQYPDLKLFIREEPTDVAVKNLEERKLDMIVFALPYPTQHLYTRILCRDHFQLVLPKKWLNKSFDKDINQIPNESLFLLEKEHCLTEHALQGCQLKNGKKINPFFATSLYSLIHMVSHYPGVTYLPTLGINKGLLSGVNLVSVPVDAYREIGVAWRSSSSKKESYNLLADLIEHMLIDISK